MDKHLGWGRMVEREGLAGCKRIRRRMAEDQVKEVRAAVGMSMG